MVPMVVAVVQVVLTDALEFLRGRPPCQPTRFLYCGYCIPGESGAGLHNEGPLDSVKNVKRVYNSINKVVMFVLGMPTTMPTKMRDGISMRQAILLSKTISPYNSRLKTQKTI